MFLSSSKRGNMVFKLRNLAGDSSCLKPWRGKLPSQTLKAVFLFHFCQLNKFESSSCYLWDYTSVCHDSSWTTIHFSLDTQKLTFFYFPLLSFSLHLTVFLIVIVCLCRLSMIYGELHNSATSFRCLYKAPLSSDNASFHCSEKDRKLYVDLLLKD